MNTKLYITGIGPFWRRMYRVHRRHGFTPEQATIAVYGGIYASRSMAATLTQAFDADARLEVIDRSSNT